MFVAVCVLPYKVCEQPIRYLIKIHEQFKEHRLAYYSYSKARDKA